MKAEDFERMKSLCEKEGFELLNVDHEDNDKFYIIAKKKDIWEGVEFLSVVGFDKIYKIKGISNDVIFVEPDMCFTKSVCVPSTEQSYFEQLKIEAFERFGEIKEGHLFDTGYGRHKTISGHPEWVYNKHIDFLYYNGLILYAKGKWATKVKERVKVEFSDFNFGIEQGKTPLVEFNFKMYPKGDLNKAGQFLAKQLEAYLNGEIE